jgi:hypothetical protein
MDREQLKGKRGLLVTLTPKVRKPETECKTETNGHISWSAVYQMMKRVENIQPHAVNFVFKQFRDFLDQKQLGPMMLRPFKGSDFICMDHRY